MWVCIYSLTDVVLDVWTIESSRVQRTKIVTKEVFDISLEDDVLTFVLK